MITDTEDTTELEHLNRHSMKTKQQENTRDQMLIDFIKLLF